MASIVSIRDSLSSRQQTSGQAGAIRVSSSTRLPVWDPMAVIQDSLLIRLLVVVGS